MFWVLNKTILMSTQNIGFYGELTKFIFQLSHYANTPMQYTVIFHGCKIVHFQMKFFNVILIFAQNIDCGYTLEPPQRGGSNEYPQSMFWSKNKKNMYTRVNPTFYI